MRKHKDFSPGLPGVSSLLVIFGVLCLLVLSLLSLSGALAQQRLARSAADSTAAFYRAELQAQTAFAQLRSGALPEGITRQGAVWKGEFPISEHQVLVVAFTRQGDAWQVLRWQAVAHSPQEEAPLPVWDGGNG